ncbi:MAG: Txe/YoeB family addiction module toxin [Dysgonamonadaceae bacterium]|jgi:Txe/YoeB family toxin of toxin-antitoxin system|nr:Txe/YoeB family addiction module toxin [Dysgonamonadaceae bacterium]
MDNYTAELVGQAKKDFEKVKKSAYKDIVIDLIKIIKNNPYQNPPPYEKLQPPRDNKYSRRINKQHRFVYKVFEEEKHIQIMSMWTHYE